MHCEDSDDDLDYTDDFDEPVMDGSDDEFSDLEGDDLDEIEEDAVDSTPDPTVNSSLDSLSSSSGSVDSAVPDPSTRGSAVPGSDPPGSPGAAGTSSSTWTTATTLIPIQPFTSPTGPVQDISSLPVDVFDLYFSPDLMWEIMKQSNAYAKLVMGPEKFNKWEKITVEELRAFLGFTIFFGINNLPSLSDYWSRDPRLRYAPVADRISRDRFREVS